jgi:hypothetical protein
MEGEEFAIKLLERPVYNPRVVWHFVEDVLTGEEDRAGSRGLIEGFAKERGHAYARTIPYWLRWIFWRTSAALYATESSFLEKRARAAKILATLYPEDDPDQPGFLNAASPLEQTEVLRALTSFSSRRLDEAVHRLYRSLKPEEFTSGEDRYELEQLEEVCVRRLFWKGYPDAVLPFAKLKAGEIETLIEILGFEASEALMNCVLWRALGLDRIIEGGELEPPNL